MWPGAQWWSRAKRMRWRTVLTADQTRARPEEVRTRSCVTRTEQSEPERGGNMAEFPAPSEGILLTHFIVSDDVERSRRFYTEVLGGETIMAGEPSFVALAKQLDHHQRGRRAHRGQA